MAALRSDRVSARELTEAVPVTVKDAFHVTGLLGVHVEVRSPRSGIVGAGAYGPGMATFAVRIVHGPAWDSRREIREQRGWDSHAAFMDALVDDGFVILGGPVGYDHGALHLVESADEQDVRARLGEDPWAESGVLRVGSVEPWLIWLDGRPKASAARQALTADHSALVDSANSRSHGSHSGSQLHPTRPA